MRESKCFFGEDLVEQWEQHQAGRDASTPPVTQNCEPGLLLQAMELRGNDTVMQCVALHAVASPASTAEAAGFISAVPAESGVGFAP